MQQDPVADSPGALAQVLRGLAATSAARARAEHVHAEGLWGLADVVEQLPPGDPSLARIRAIWTATDGEAPAAVS